MPAYIVLTLPLSPGQIAVAIVMATFGALIQGSVGFGFAAVSAPILLFLHNGFVPGPTLLASMLLVILMALRERHEVIVEDIGLATAGRVIGMAPAAYAIRILPQPVYELVFGSFVLLGTVLSALGRHLPPTRKNIFLGGVGSGFVGTLSSVGGPLMALMYQNEKGPRIRATLAAIFTLGTLISIAGLWFAGRFGWTEMLLGSILMPGVLMGFALSGYVTRLIDQGHMRPAVLIISMVSSVAVILRALATYFGL